MIQELENNEVFSTEYRNAAPKKGDLAAVFEKDGRKLLMSLNAEGAMSLPDAVLSRGATRSPSRIPMRSQRLSGSPATRSTPDTTTFP